MNQSSASKLPVKTGRRSRSLSRPTLIGKPSISTSSRDLRAMSQTPRISISRSSHRPSSTSSNVEGSARTYRSVSQTPRLNTPSRSRSTDYEKKMKKKDPRPITEKTWQAKQVANTQQYLLERGACDLLNNGKNLRPLTLQMFVQILNYLLGSILTNYEDLTVKTYVDRLPKQLNALYYSGAVSNSVLKTANTMHSWPTVLAILSYLVEINKLAFDEDEESDEEFNEQEDLVKKIMLKASYEAYALFNKGKPTTETENWVGKEFVRIFNLPDNVQEYVENINNNVEIIQKERAEKQLKNKSEIDDLEHKLMEGQNRLANVEENCQTIEQNIQQLQSKGQAIIKTSEKLDTEVEKKKERLEKLRSPGLVTPEMQMDIKDKITALKAEKKLKLEMMEHREKLSHEIDESLKKLRAELFDKIKMHNLALVKPSLKYPEIEELFVPEECFMQPNMLEIMTGIHKKKETFMKKRLQCNKCLEQKFKACKDQLQQAESTLESNIKEAEMSTKMITAKEQDLEGLKDCSEKMIQQYNAKSIKIQNKCIDITNSMTGLDTKKEIKEKLVESYKEWQDKLPKLAQKMVYFFDQVQAASYEQITQLDKQMESVSAQWRKELECLKR